MDKLDAMQQHSQFTIDGETFDISNIRGKITLAEPMSKHTTWKVGGQAKIYYQPQNSGDLQNFLKLFGNIYPVIWLGLGSNVLVRDKGINGLVINALGCMNKIEMIAGEDINRHLVTAQAGVTCSKFSRVIADHGLSGAEFLSGIPGTMGGAIAMNAGAFGGECWGNLEAVESIDAYGQIHHRKAAEYVIGYRRVARQVAQEHKTYLHKPENGALYPESFATLLG